MKNYLFGLLAVILAISFSAFTAKHAAKKTFTNLYWFKVKTGHGTQSAFLNSEVILMSTVGSPTEAPPSEPCDTDTDTYKCVVGFDPTKVNGSGNLIDAAGTSPVSLNAIDQYRHQDVE